MCSKFPLNYTSCHHAAKLYAANARALEALGFSLEPALLELQVIDFVIHI